MADPRFKNLEIKVGLFILTSLIMIVALIVGILEAQDELPAGIVGQEVIV